MFNRPPRAEGRASRDRSRSPLGTPRERSPHKWPPPLRRNAQAKGPSSRAWWYPLTSSPAHLGHGREGDHLSAPADPTAIPPRPRSPALQRQQQQDSARNRAVAAQRRHAEAAARDEAQRARSLAAENAKRQAEIEAGVRRLAQQQADRERLRQEQRHNQQLEEQLLRQRQAEAAEQHLAQQQVLRDQLQHEQLAQQQLAREQLAQQQAALDVQRQREAAMQAPMAQAQARAQEAANLGAFRPATLALPSAGAQPTVFAASAGIVGTSRDVSPDFSSIHSTLASSAGSPQGMSPLPSPAMGTNGVPGRLPRTAACVNLSTTGSSMLRPGATAEFSWARLEAQATGPPPQQQAHGGGIADTRSPPIGGVATVVGGPPSIGGQLRPTRAPQW